MKKNFAKIIVREIRLMREENDMEMYSFRLGQLVAKNNIALELGIISIEKWRMVHNLIYSI